MEEKNFERHVLSLMRGDKILRVLYQLSCRVS
jgi:hypothetical protein